MMDELIGKTVRAIYRTDDNETLRFETDSGNVDYGTYGDCCSETWFHEIFGLDALLGATVTAVEDVDMGAIEASRQESDQLYGIKIATTKGRSLIAFRNSSNGYYGGDVFLYDKEPKVAAWIPVKEDFAASPERK